MGAELVIRPVSEIREKPDFSQLRRGRTGEDARAPPSSGSLRFEHFPAKH